jgi:hypothetical protein
MMLPLLVLAVLELVMAEVMRHTAVNWRKTDLDYPGATLSYGVAAGCFGCAVATGLTVGGLWLFT